MTTAPLRRRKLVTALAFALTLLVWALALPHMRVTMAITHFLPDARAGKIAEILHALAESDLARTTIVDLSLPEDAPDARAQLIERAQRFVHALAEAPSVERVQSGLEPGEDMRTVEALRGVPPSAFLPRERFDAEAYPAALAALKEQLGGPLGPLARAFAPADPLGGTLQLLDRLRNLEGAPLESDSGILISAEGAHAFVFVHGRGSAFDADTQRVFLRELDQARERCGLRMELSSVAKYTVMSEATIRGDIERIGTISTVGILLLFGLFFRSLRMLLLALVPLVFGTTLATLVCWLAFGSIHGITLAFGSSLLGVGIDYAEHYFSHFALGPERGADGVMREVRPGLGLGALTTIAGLFGIAWADFPGAVELAAFACLAVLGSLIGTVWFLPPWMPASYKRPALPARLEHWGLGVLAFLRRGRAVLWGSALLVVLLALGLWRLHFSDDVAVLISIDAEVSAEDARVRGRVTRAEPGRFVVVTEDESGDKLDATERALAQAKDDGVLEHYVPLGAILRSPRAQRESFAAAQASAPALERALTDAGFAAAAFAPYFEALRASEPALFSRDKLQNTPLSKVIDPLCPLLDGKQAHLIPVGGVRDEAALRSRLSAATYIDEGALLQSTYAHVRARVLQLAAFSLLFVVFTLRVRYRSSRVALAAFVPALLAALCTIGTLSWCGIPLNVLHVVGLVLVLSMGVDFGIFVAEGRHEDLETARSLVGIFTATLTTLLSFGLLALSHSPALRALGTTMTMGLTFSLLLCPAVFVLTETRK